MKQKSFVSNVKRNKTINQNYGMIINNNLNLININEENSMIENESREDIDNIINDSFYICLMISIEKNEYNKYLIENELNELEYNYYRKIEVRKWYNIIWSHFKINCDLLSTFYTFNKYKDFRIYTIKISIYLNSLVLSLVGNVFFYHDDTMHKIYEENGKYNIVYKLPYIAISDIISILASLFFEHLIDYQEALINLKINMNEEKRREETIKIEKSFRRNRKYFYILIFALQIFSWYYLSCFFSLYINTQIHLLKDFLLGQVLSLGNLIIRMFIFNLNFKLCATKCNSKYNRFLNCIFKIINNYWFNILLEFSFEFTIYIIFKI